MVTSTCASSSETLRMQAVSWLVNWGLGAVGPGVDVASAYRPPLSSYRFTHLGSSSMLFLRLAQPLSVARSYARRAELSGVYKLRPTRAAR
jgi:hypothetical protein